MPTGAPPDARAFRLGLAGIAAVTLWRLALLPFDARDLFVDEAQYWFWGRELAWGYYSKPPLIGWLMRLSTAIGSDAPFWLRAPLPLIHAATAVVVALIGRAAVRRPGRRHRRARLRRACPASPSAACWSRPTRRCSSASRWRCSPGCGWSRRRRSAGRPRSGRPSGSACWPSTRWSTSRSAPPPRACCCRRCGSAGATRWSPRRWRCSSSRRTSPGTRPTTSPRCSTPPTTPTGRACGSISPASPSSSAASSPSPARCSSPPTSSRWPGSTASRAGASWR